MPEETDIRKMKVVELRAALEKRGLNPDGLKADLINRLQQRLDEEEFGLETNFGTTMTSTVATTEPAGAKQVGKKKTLEESDDATPTHNNVTTTITTTATTEMTWEIDTTPAVVTDGDTLGDTKGAVDEYLAKLEDEIKKAKRMGLPFQDLLKKKKEILKGEDLEEKKKLRAQRFGSILSKSSSTPAGETMDVDDELLANLEEEIKKAKRMGLPFQDLLKKKKEILQRKNPTKQEGDVQDNRNKRNLKSAANKKNDEAGASKNDRNLRNSKDSTANQKKQSKNEDDKRKRVGDDSSGRAASTDDVSPSKKQRVVQQATKQLSEEDELNKLPLSELQKRLDRAEKFKAEASTINKLKAAIMKKDSVDVEELPLPELQKRLDRAKKFGKNDAVDKIKEAIIKKPSDLESLSKEELQKLLDRAEKFKTEGADVDKIKAAMRKFRFG